MVAFAMHVVNVNALVNYGVVRLAMASVRAAAVRVIAARRTMIANAMPAVNVNALAVYGVVHLAMASVRAAAVRAIAVVRATATVVGTMTTRAVTGIGAAVIFLMMSVIREWFVGFGARVD